MTTNSVTNSNFNQILWDSYPTDSEERVQAVGRITRAFASHATQLDLSGLDIGELPACIGKLTTLKILNLAGTGLKSLPESLGQLTNLQALNLNYNRDLEDLPSSLGRISSLAFIATVATGISRRREQEIMSQIHSLQEQKKKGEFKRDSLLFSRRPPEVQVQIDRVHQSLVTTGTSWGHNGNIGFYNLLNFDDRDVITQRIDKAPPSKEDLYFIDLGAGHFSWVDNVSAFLRSKYSDDKRRFHVIGVTGEGGSVDVKKVSGNVTTHKISGFKLENLLESFEKLGLPLVNSVEFIVTSWTLQHLVDPLGTLEQAYHLLSCGNGMLFGDGFNGERYYHHREAGGRHALGAILSQAFGIHSYVAKRTDSSRPDSFALLRSDRGKHSYAKGTFVYNTQSPIIEIDGRYDCFAQCYANLTCIKPAGDCIYDMGGGFYGFAPYVLEQLLGE